MAAKLIVTIVVIPFYGRVLNRAVHPFDLPVGPWMVWLGQAMLDLVCGADHVEPHGPGVRRVAVARLLTNLDAVVCQDYIIEFIEKGAEGDT